MSGSTVSIGNSRSQSIDTIYTAGGVKKLKLAIGNVDVSGDTEDGAWQGIATHPDGATFNASDGVVVLAGLDGTTVRKALVDSTGKLIVNAVPTSGNLTDRSGSIAVGATAQSLAASLAGRKYFFFQNISDTDMWINFGSSAVADEPSIRVEAGSSFSMEGSFVSSQSISVICATSTKKFTAKEA